MNINITEVNVPSTDGIHILKGKIYLPSGEIKGLFQIVHGMTEHIDRYDEIMTAIANDGYICFGFNNLGHKGTASDDELGFIAENGGYKYLVDDVAEFYKAVHEKYPYDKYILMGHSMGSFIARLAAEKYSEYLNGLIICGTGSNCYKALFGAGLASLIGKFKGKRYCSKLLAKLVFGSYNKGFEGISNQDWLTNDRDIINKYKSDKYCNFQFSVSAIKDLLMLSYLANRNDWYKHLPKDLPILLISGDSDPVGNKGKGVKSIFKKLRFMELKNTNMFLYKNCRHEVLNDICKKEVTADILEFIN